MAADTTVLVELRFMDRKGRTRTTTVRYAFSNTVATVISAINEAIAAYQPLSNAVITGWKIKYHVDIDEPGTAEIGSDARSILCLIYRDEERYECLLVPSPKPEIFEDEGAYSGIRVKGTATEMVPWTDPASTILAYLKTPEGLAWPTQYLVGGKEL